MPQRVGICGPVRPAYRLPSWTDKYQHVGVAEKTGRNKHHSSDFAASDPDIIFFQLRQNAAEHYLKAEQQTGFN